MLQLEQKPPRKPQAYQAYLKLFFHLPDIKEKFNIEWEAAKEGGWNPKNMVSQLFIRVLKLQLMQFVL
jgi:hypothetical protein